MISRPPTCGGIREYPALAESITTVDELHRSTGLCSVVTD
jgi:hypothetical protein